MQSRVLKPGPYCILRTFHWFWSFTSSSSKVEQFLACYFLTVNIFLNRLHSLNWQYTK